MDGWGRIQKTELRLGRGKRSTKGTKFKEVPTVRVLQVWCWFLFTFEPWMPLLPHQSTSPDRKGSFACKDKLYWPQSLPQVLRPGHTHELGSVR